jgi:hypothetical protein
MALRYKPSTSGLSMQGAVIRFRDRRGWSMRGRAMWGAPGTLRWAAERLAHDERRGQPVFFQDFTPGFQDGQVALRLSTGRKSRSGSGTYSLNILTIAMPQLE